MDLQEEKEFSKVSNVTARHRQETKNYTLLFFLQLGTSRSLTEGIGKVLPAFLVMKLGCG